jgi:hypothetical protein
VQRVAARHLFAELRESAWCDPANDSDGLKHLLGVPLRDAMPIASSHLVANAVFHAAVLRQRIS